MQKRCDYMKGCLTILSLFFLLAQPAAILPGSPGGHSPDPGAAGPSDGFVWPQWSRDADGNRLDDELDYWLANRNSERLPVVVCYDRMPSGAESGALGALGGQVTFVSGFLPYLTAVLPADAVQKASRLPRVVRLEAAVPLELCLDSSVPSIGVDKVWQTLGFRGDGMVICVIDSGIDGNHTALDDLDDNNITRDPKIIAFYDAADSPERTDGSTTPFDPDGHGTHVAAIAAGTGRGDPDFRYIGVAPAAKLVGVKILLNGSADMSTDIALRGIEWAMANRQKYGIGVLSMSFGAKFVAPGITNDGSSAMSQLCDRAVEEGLVCVAAAGNSGPARRSITPPGDARGVITVGNVRDDHSLNPSSSRGPVGRFSDSYTKPDVCAPGTDVYSAEANSGNRFISETGTSQACPHVSALAALMLQALPSLRPADVMSILRSTAEPEKSYPWQSSPNNDYGYGTVNALRAVENCTNGTLPPVVYINPLDRVNGTVAVTGTASSVHGTVRTVEVRIDGGAYQPAVGTTTWSYLWNTTAQPNGLHYIIARAFDGEVYSYEFRTAVQVYNLLVSIERPAPAPMQGLVTFSGTADGEVQRVQVRIDNQSWEDATDTSNSSFRTWSYTFNTTRLPDGAHHLEARAFDGTQYSTLSQVDFTVKNPKRPPPPSKFIPGMDGLMMLLATGTGLALAIARQRCRSVKR